MKTDRLFQLLFLLLQKENLTAPQLAKQLEVSVRTVYRDVETLSGAGVPVYAQAGKNGGISLLEGYAVSKALFSDKEQNQLLFALQSLRVTERPMDALLSKLGGLFHKRDADWIAIDFSRWGFGRLDGDRFAQLRDAILEKQVIRIEYYNVAGEFTTRDIKPFRLVFKSRGWYVQAFCIMADDYRLFKVSRIRALMCTGESFTDVFPDQPPVEPFPIDTQRTVEVSLLFTTMVAYRVFDEYDPMCIQKQDDGLLRVTLHLPSPLELASYLLTFGTDVTVLYPLELRDALSQMAEKIAAHHRT